VAYTFVYAILFYTVLPYSKEYVTSSTLGAPSTPQCHHTLNYSLTLISQEKAVMEANLSTTRSQSASLTAQTAVLNRDLKAAQTQLLQATVTAEKAGEVTVGEAVQQRRVRDEFEAHSDALEGEVAALRAAQGQRGEEKL
jgi:hypothetical protein